MSNAAERTSSGAYRFRPWFTVAFVVFMTVVTVAMRIAIGISWTAVIAAPIAGTFGFWHTMALRFEKQGPRVGRTTARWSDLELHRGRWGESLRSNARTDAGDGPGRFNVFLPSYFADWRSGVVGDELRRRAPHLFEPETGEDR